MGAPAPTPPCPLHYKKGQNYLCDKLYIILIRPTALADGSPGRWKGGEGATWVEPREVQRFRGSENLNQWGSTGGSE